VGKMMASFPLRFWAQGTGGIFPPEGRRYRATAVSLKAVSDEVTKSSYEAAMWLSFSGGEESYQARFQTPFKAPSTPVTVGERMDAWGVRARASYPYMARVPSVRYDTLSEQMGRFVVTLCPFTSLYTDVKGFWQTLGYEPEQIRTFEGAKMKGANAEAPIWGFTNRSADAEEVFGREMMHTEDMALLYGLFADGAPVAQPKLELRFFQDSLPIALAKRKPLNRTAVSDGLASLLDDGLKILSVDEGAVFFELTDKSLFFRSKEYPSRTLGAGTVTVHLQFGRELKNWLKMEEESLSFPMDDPRTYQMDPRDEAASDPLLPFYPVTMLLQQGPAVNYVEGQGFCSVLGILRDPDDVIGGAGIVVYGDSDELTVSFLDKTLKPINLKETLTCYLTLEFHALF
jgi:hypothetical protein